MVFLKFHMFSDCIFLSLSFHFGRVCPPHLKGSFSSIKLYLFSNRCILEVNNIEREEPFFFKIKIGMDTFENVNIISERMAWNRLITCRNAKLWLSQIWNSTNKLFFCSDRESWTQRSRKLQAKNIFKWNFSNLWVIGFQRRSWLMRINQ